MRLSRRVRVTAAVAAIGIAFSLTGCSNNPEASVVVGGVTYTEDDISVFLNEYSEMVDAAVANGEIDPGGAQIPTRADTVKFLGEFGAITEALERAGIATADDVQKAGRDFSPELGIVFQLNNGVGQVIQQVANVDPEGASAIVNAAQVWPAGSKVNPRYGQIKGGAISPTFGDVVTVSSEQIQ